MSSFLKLVFGTMVGVELASYDTAYQAARTLDRNRRYLARPLQGQRSTAPRQQNSHITYNRSIMSWTALPITGSHPKQDWMSRHRYLRVSA
jgi:uncharacterized membrane protein YccC